MANTKSALKAIKTNRRNHARNLGFKTRMKTAIKTAKIAIEENNSEKENLVKSTLQVIDKTAAKGVIKKQKASRLKSRLQKALNSAEKAPKKEAPKKATKKAAPKSTKPKTEKPKKEAPKKEAKVTEEKSNKQETKAPKEAKD